MFPPCGAGKQVGRLCCVVFFIFIIQTTQNEEMDVESRDSAPCGEGNRREIKLSAQFSSHCLVVALMHVYLFFSSIFFNLGIYKIQTNSISKENK